MQVLTFEENDPIPGTKRKAGFPGVFILDENGEVLVSGTFIVTHASREAIKLYTYPGYGQHGEAGSTVYLSPEIALEWAKKLIELLENQP